MIVFEKVQQVKEIIIHFSLGCNYFKSLIRFKFDLSKIQALDSDPKAIQHINFTVSLAQQALKNRRKQV